MSKSGFIAEPTRPIIGMNIANVVYIRYMLSIRGTQRDDKWTTNHFQSGIDEKCIIEIV